MAIVPTRHQRTSMADQFATDFRTSPDEESLARTVQMLQRSVAGMTPEQIRELAVKSEEAKENNRIAEAERKQEELRNLMTKRYSLDELMGNENFARMMNSLLKSRVRLASDAEQIGDVSSYGYIYEPDRGEWGLSLKDDADQIKAPWYKTAREVLNAIYDDGLVGDNGMSAAGFSRQDFMDKATEIMQGLVDEQLANDPDGSIREKLLKGGVLEGGDTYTEGKSVVNPFSDHGTLYKLASFVLPMRTAGLMSDPELSSTAGAGDYAKAAIGDVIEAGLTTFNPLGRALNWGAKGAKVASPMVRHALESGVGNLLNYGATHGYDELADRENQFQSNGMSKEDALVALGAGLLPTGFAFAKNRFDKSKNNILPFMTQRDKAEGMLADALKRPYGSVPKELVDEFMDKGTTWESFLKKPFRDLEKQGYPNVATPKVPATDLSESNFIENTNLMMLDLLPPSRRGKFRDWAKVNREERNALYGGQKHRDLVRDASTSDVPSDLNETWESYAFNQDNSPGFYKRNFKVPMRSESETIESIAPRLYDENLNPTGRDFAEMERRMNLGDKASEEYAIRRTIHDALTKSKNVDWQATPWSKPVSDYGVKHGGVNPGNGYGRKTLEAILRMAGVNDPYSSNVEQKNPTSAVRGGVPTRRKEKQ